MRYTLLGLLLLPLGCTPDVTTGKHTQSVAALQEEAPSEPDTFDCGDLTCQQSEYCEVIHSDVPEFDGSYTRHRCLPIPDPGCDLSRPCECLVDQGCDYGGLTFKAFCSSAPTGTATLTCDIGG